VVATGASVVCTACPFCLAMLEEGVRDAAPASEIRVLDLAELVEEALSAAGRPDTLPER
jgi:heterodisulfide reductase subunit D